MAKMIPQSCFGKTPCAMVLYGHCNIIKLLQAIPSLWIIAKRFQSDESQGKPKKKKALMQRQNSVIQ
jgi:hypothetical protein